MKLAISLATLALPAIALACPACARDNFGPGTYAMLGTMIFSPFAIAFVVIRVIKKGERE